MADLRVETAGLRSHAATFDAVAEEQRAGASLAQSGVESDIAAFGEINAALHEPWRTANAMKEQAWNDLSRRNSEHADKLRANASGYDDTDASNSGLLGSAGLD
ncbi:MAG: type VII secretion target [Mycolicibacterium sp.]|uniref:type VII secretion target n=1 Tax=Mycolicibacterium sp. TaxID=2320850 RepID=UPI003D0E6935